MQNIGNRHFSLKAPKETNLLFPVLLIWGVGILGALLYFLYTDDTQSARGYLFLLPWCFLTGVVLLAPSAYLYYKKQFNPFHPLVFPVWSFFFPGFVGGGLILALEIVHPWYFSYIQDERYSLPLTLVYVAIAYASLTLGFYLPWGRNFGTKISNFIPKFNWKAQDVVKPGLFLLALGFFNSIIGFAFGLLGYQKVEQIGAFDGLVYFFTLFWYLASFILWLCIFRMEKLTIIEYLTIAILIVSSFARSTLEGNRSGLLHVFFLVAFAFIFSQRKITVTHKISGVVLIVAVILFGMIYGTTFRSIRLSNEKVDIEEYVGTVAQSFEQIGNQDSASVLYYGFESLAERIESVSSLAVLVSNYETLAPYEESYGLDNNIWKDSINFFIPRFLYTEKQIATDTFSYGDLYFNFSNNSFAMTPMGDLLRNFGPIGIPVGMILIGLLLRTIYAALIENQKFSVWRIAMFYMLLTSINYEGSFGLLLPYMIRVGFVAMVGIGILWFFLGSGRQTLASGLSRT